MTIGVEELLLAAVEPLLDLKGQPEAMTKLNDLIAKISRRLSA